MSLDATAPKEHELCFSLRPPCRYAATYLQSQRQLRTELNAYAVLTVSMDIIKVGNCHKIMEADG